MICLNIIISFFRDILDGPLYVIMVIVFLFVIVVCLLSLIANIKKITHKEENTISIENTNTTKIDYSTGVDYTNTIISVDSENKSSYSGDVYSDDDSKNS